MNSKLAKHFLTVASVALVITMLFVATAVIVSAEGEATETTAVAVPFKLALSKGTNTPTEAITSSNLTGYIGGGPSNTLRMNSNDDYFEFKISVTTPGTYYLSAEVARGAYSDDKRLKFEVKEIEGSAIVHVISKVDHWGVASENIGTFTFAQAGEYTIRVSDSGTQLFGSNYQNHTTFIRSVTLKEKLAAPTGITVIGSTFSGLDPAKSYALASYTIVGADDTNAVAITGKDTVNVRDCFEKPVGLYAIYYMGDDTHTNSDAGAVCYVAGDFAGREIIGNKKTVNYSGTQKEDGDGNGVLDEYNETFMVPSGIKGIAGATPWTLGQYTGADYYYSFDKGKLKFNDYGVFKADYMYYTTYSVDDYNAAVAYEALSEAEQAEATKPVATSAEILEDARDTYRSVKVRYAYDTDDIIPISEVVSIKFGTYSRYGGAYSFSFNTAKAKYVFHIMDETGKITEVTYISSEAVSHSGSGNAYETVIVANIEGMPTEGWLVGWEYYPYGALETTEIIAKSSASSNKRLGITFILPNVMAPTHYSIKGVKTPPFNLALSDGTNTPTEAILSSELSGYIGSGPSNTLRMNSTEDYFEFKVNVTTPGTYYLSAEVARGTAWEKKLKFEVKEIADSAIVHTIKTVSHWSVASEDIGTFTFTKAGEYTIRVSCMGSDSSYNGTPTQNRTTFIKSVSFKVKHPSIKDDITVEGTTFSGLDSTKSYMLASYTAAGAANAVEITGKETVDVNDYFTDPVGLYGLYIQGYDVYVDSDPVLVYVKGSYVERAELGANIMDKYGLVRPYTYSLKMVPTYTDEKTGVTTNRIDMDSDDIYYNLTWEPGMYSGYRSYYATTATYGRYFSGDWRKRDQGSAADLKAALATEDTADEIAIQTKYKNLIENQVLRYSYASNEIVPVDELISMRVGTWATHGAITVNSAKMKLVVYVMDDKGEATPYTWISEAFTPSYSTERTFRVDIQSIEGLPTEGWIVGWEYYPAGIVELSDIVSTSDSTTQGFELAAIAGFRGSAELGSEFYVDRKSDHDWYVIKEEQHVEFGMSLVLDGKVGVKVTASALHDGVSDFAVEGYEGIYEDFGANDYATFYFVPKEIADANVTVNVSYTCEGVKKTETLTLTVADYIAALKETADAKTLALIEAFETYALAAKAYFGDETEVEALEALTTDELADLRSKRMRTKEGVIEETLEFYSTSLILEDDTTIRHYFKLLDDAAFADGVFVVEGAGDLTEAAVAEGSEEKYVYVDITGIAADELDEVMTVTVSVDTTNPAYADYVETITVNFNALAYVDLCVDEEENVKLANLAKALYRYSAAAEAYAAN